MSTLKLKYIFYFTLFTVTVTASLILVELTGATGTRLISHRQELAEVTANPGDGYEKAGPSGHSKRPSISADGRYVAFESEAGYFDKLDLYQWPNPIPEDSDIFLHDTELDKTTRVSIEAGGVKANGESYNADISPNGNWIVFESDATNLVTGDSNGKRDIFRYERFTAQLDLISKRSSGAQATNDSTNGSVADDGSVAFQTSDSQMTSITDGNNWPDVFLRDASGQVKLVSVKHNGSAATGGTSSMADVSGDGKTVAFWSDAGALDLTNQADNSYLGNLYARTFFVGEKPETKLVSADIKGDPAGLYLNFGHDLSRDGRFIVFTSLADNLVTETKGMRGRLFVAEMKKTGPVEIKLLAQDLKAITSWFRYPDISPNGKWVAYQYDHLGSVEQIILVPRSGGTPQIASVANDGTAVTSGFNMYPSVSNKATVAFQSNSLRFKQNYLGRGLFSWSEIYDDGYLNKPPCDPDECDGISLRETTPGSIEPGPSNPTPAVNGGEPLVKVKTTSNKAGGATDMTVTLKRPFNYHEFRHVEFKMPAGLSANTNVKKCTKAQANQPDPSDSPNLGCPDGSRVGTVHTDIELVDNLHDIAPYIGDKYKKNKDGSFPKNGMDGGVYFGEPQAGEAGRLYAVVFDEDLLKVPVVVPLSITVLSGDNYRFKIEAKDIPNEIPNAHIKKYNGFIFDQNIEFGTVYPNIERITFTIFGNGVKTANGHSFMRNPSFSTSSDLPANQMGVEAKLDNYGGSRNTRALPYALSGTPAFAPKLKTGLSTKKLNAKPVIQTEIAQQVEETAMKEMRLSFKGFGIDVLSGLAGCSAAQRSSNTCPAASKLATVEAHSWMLTSPLKGDLYLGSGAKSAFMTLNGLIDLNVEGRVEIDAAKGKISLDIDRGMPPFSGSRITASVDGGLLKNPSECGKPAQISLDATSYSGQRYTDTETFNYCTAASSGASASLKVKLSPARAKSYTKAAFTFKQASKREAKKLKGLDIKLGKGKSRLYASTKALKRKTRGSKKTKTLGALQLYSKKKGRTIKAKVRTKRGGIYISPSTKELRRYKRTIKRLRKKKTSNTYKKAKKEFKHLRRVHSYLKKKTKVRISKGKVRLTRIPTRDAYYRVYLKFDGKRFRTLRNPKRKGKVTFTALAKPTKGEKITAKRVVSIKKAQSKKKKSKRSK